MFVIIGICSIIVGTLGGLKQTNIIKLLGQSSIMNIGLFFLAITLNEYFIVEWFIILYIFYSMLLIQIFSILFLIQYDKIISLSSILSISYLLFFLLSISLFSFSAIPPLNGYLFNFIFYQLF